MKKSLRKTITISPSVEEIMARPTSPEGPRTFKQHIPLRKARSGKEKWIEAVYPKDVVVASKADLGRHTIVKDKSITCGYAICAFSNTEAWACWLQIHPVKCIFHRGWNENHRSIKHLIPYKF